MKQTLFFLVMSFIVNTIKTILSQRLLIIFLIVISVPTFSQTHINQNRIQTSVIGSFSANVTQPRRFEIATVGYNSYNWQLGGVIIVELFHINYSAGYEKYSVEIGYAQGGQENPEVEQFIKTNKYLPEVPSEKQMQSDGLNMNEFSIKLLQKIEELTLYVIQQDKKNQELEQKNRNVSNRFVQKNKTIKANI